MELKNLKEFLYKYYLLTIYIIRYPFRKVSFPKALWSKRQFEEELDYWKNPEIYEPLEDYKSMKERLLDINLKMFKRLKRNFRNGVVCEVGCGAYGGVLPMVNAKYKFGVDPLASEYQKIHKEPGIIMLESLAENLPFTDESLDAIFCINTLDHVQNPFQVLNEIYRVLKKGGYFAFSVDIGGTPHHPHIIYKSDLDNEFNKRYRTIEKRYSRSIKTSWNPLLNIPLYVFQGQKK